MRDSASQAQTFTDAADECVRHRLLPPHRSLATHHGRCDWRGEARATLDQRRVQTTVVTRR